MTSLYSGPTSEFVQSISLDVNGLLPPMVACDEAGLRIEFYQPQTIGLDEVDLHLPFDGLRNTVHRSAWAKTGMLLGQTQEDSGRSRPVGFESSLERSTAISALIHPNTAGFKCQPRQIVFDQDVDGVKSNTLDFLVTLKTGQKTYLFVKNEASLSKEKTARICAAIRKVLPEGFGFAPISDAEFSPVLRGNLERLYLAKRESDAEADRRLEQVLHHLIDVERFSIEELVVRCNMGPRQADSGRAFNAILRAIADQKIATDRHKLIDYPMVVGHAS